jgi:hypothetical protein
MLSVLSTTACRLITRTLGVPPSASLSCGSGGRISAALVTVTDAGRIMGKMSWMSGKKDAILLRYPWASGRCIRQMRRAQRRAGG